MALTLSQARQRLYKYVSATFDSQLVTTRINSALERIYNSGKWKGMLQAAQFINGSDPAVWWAPDEVNYLTLPRKYQAVLGVQYAALGLPGIPKQIYPQWQEYMAGGGGQVSAGTGMQMIIDMGDGYATFADPTAKFVPFFVTTDPQDTNVTVKATFTDYYGNPMYDPTGNASFTISANTISGNPTVGKLIGLQKPATQGLLYLYAVNPDDTTQKALIAAYEPTETIPSYKRYRTSGSDFAAQLNCLCKRRYVELVNGLDDDTVIVPSNEGALKLTLMALQYEDKNDIERAEQYFNKAIQLLNAELKEDMGVPVITLQMNPVAAAMRIPNRF